ncbi:MAG: Nif3-like dinuclear metal center hexameric protein [Balneolaceae bacterium]|nr:MAG: Nif3-like dinuclear metal center hexameric protein [Balneolaceae bacterium]
MKTSANHISDFFQDWAPLKTKLDYDNVGLLIGQPDKPVKRVLVCLDVTDDVVQEAIDTGSHLIVAHHPVIFKKLSSVTTADATGRLVYHLIRNDIAVLAVHTNLDAAREGVSFAMAEKIGLKNCRFLESSLKSLQLVRVTCPANHSEKITALLAKTGVRAVTVPITDDSGSDNDNDNGYALVEFTADSFRLPAIVASIEELIPGFRNGMVVIPVDQPSQSSGFGVTGELDEPLGQNAFLERLAGRLGSSSIRYSGSSETIKKVAVCGGAGVSLAERAMASGADAFVTADVKYHDFFSGKPGFLLADVGHYESEVHILETMVMKLKKSFPDLEIFTTRVNTNPVQSFALNFELNKNTEPKKSE